jgi:hypothetical protein
MTKAADQTPQVHRCDGEKSAVWRCLISAKRAASRCLTPRQASLADIQQHGQHQQVVHAPSPLHSTHKCVLAEKNNPCCNSTLLSRSTLRMRTSNERWPSKCVTSLNTEQPRTHCRGEARPVLARSWPQGLAHLNLVHHLDELLHALVRCLGLVRISSRRASSRGCRLWSSARCWSWRGARRHCGCATATRLGRGPRDGPARHLRHREFIVCLTQSHAQNKTRTVRVRFSRKTARGIYERTAACPSLLALLPILTASVH